MIGRTNAGGGGGDSLGKAFAIIAVIYPKGSTLTCSNGTKTYKAGNTYGAWAFGVNAAGTWTITATDGDKTKAVEIEITEQGQSESVTLSYAFYIFKQGEGLTSGYSLKNKLAAPTVSVNTISWMGDSSSGGVSAYIEPAVVLTEYTKLCVDFECSYNFGELYNSTYYGFGAGVGTDAAVAPNITHTSWTATASNTTKGAIARTTVECDISALADAEYIKIVGQYSAGKIYNIWLE